MICYVASKSRFWPWWQALRAAGLPIVADWIDWPHNIDDSEPDDDEWRAHAEQCIEQAAAADILLLYVDREDARQFGALLETGRRLVPASRSSWSRVTRGRSCATTRDAVRSLRLPTPCARSGHRLLVRRHAAIC
jgi:hypothetical protein